MQQLLQILTDTCHVLLSDPNHQIACGLAYLHSKVGRFPVCQSSDLDLCLSLSARGF
jgi:hypothetical protein